MTPEEEHDVAAFLERGPPLTRKAFRELQDLHHRLVRDSVARDASPEVGAPLWVSELRAKGFDCKSRAESGVPLAPAESKSKRKKEKEKEKEKESSQEKGKEKEKGQGYWWALVLVLLAAWVANWGEKERSEMELCARGDGERKMAAMKSVSDALERKGVGNRKGVLQAFAAFADQVGFDWEAEERDPLAPKHAVSMRVQGGDTQFIQQVFVRDFLQSWLTPECYKSRVLEVNLESEKSPDQLVMNFLEELKARNSRAVAIIVLERCFGTHGSHAALRFKDFLNDKLIPVKGQYLNSEGLGFAFLGGEMDETKCSKEDIESYDSKMGWERNLIGRISSTIGICQSISKETV